jgi:hypothetical protein
VLISVTKDMHAFNAEEYLCPVYQHSLFPSCTDILGLPACEGDAHPGGAQEVREEVEEVVLLRIPMETTEDVEDCRMYSIGIHAGHRSTHPE